MLSCDISAYTVSNALTVSNCGDYEVRVVYHWGEGIITDLGTISASGEQTLEPVSYDYGKVGEYYAGVSVTWGDGSGCSSTMITAWSRSMDRRATLSTELRRRRIVL